MADVLSWVDTQNLVEPLEILAQRQRAPAGLQLGSMLELDPRNRGTTYMSAAALLAVYRYPEVIARDRAELTATGFLDKTPSTLYIVSADRQQQLLAPLIVAMLSALLHEAAERANRGRTQVPTLRVLIDEAANIAPLRRLPAHLSQAAGHGIHIASVWQSIAQIRAAYRAEADAILANSNTKPFMGPITDDATRTYLSGLLGDELVEAPPGPRPTDGPRSPASSWRPKATAQALQQLERDRAVLVEGSTPPAVVRLAPWWQQRQLRERGHYAG